MTYGGNVPIPNLISLGWIHKMCSRTHDSSRISNLFRRLCQIGLIWFGLTCFCQAEASVIDDLRQRAQNGDVAAETELADHYYFGRETSPDHKEALFWYVKAAESGNAYAQFFVGEYFFTGDSIPQNYESARLWFERSAAQGFAFAQCALGDIYLKGFGVSRDRRLAFEWYQKAAAHLGLMMLQGKGGPQDADGGLSWMSRAAKKGNALAIDYLRAMGFEE